jgi:hypothetical protein
MVQRILLVVGFVIATTTLPACSPTIRKPRLASPGSAPVQRYNATQFDPYPLPDMGPEIVGGRPPDFTVPVPEVERANQYRQGQRAIETLPPAPGVFVPTFPTAPPPTPPVMMPTYPPQLPTYPSSAATPAAPTIRPLHRY